MMLLNSIKNALKGILYCIKSEKNIRVHTVAVLYVLVFSIYFNLSNIQYAILFLTMAVVISMECINTAIEKMLDFEYQGYNNFVKVIKDISAGAVLISAVGSVCVGINLFFDINKWYKLIYIFKANMFLQIIALLSVIISVIYINGINRSSLQRILNRLNKKERICKLWKKNRRL